MPTDPGPWSPDRWFLTAAERDNDATALDPLTDPGYVRSEDVE